MVNKEMEYLNTIFCIKFMVCLLDARVEALCAILKLLNSLINFLDKKAI